MKRADKIAAAIAVFLVTVWVVAGFASLFAILVEWLP